jgi:hypothetical protein
MHSLILLRVLLNASRKSETGRNRASSSSPTQTMTLSGTVERDLPVYGVWRALSSTTTRSFLIWNDCCASASKIGGIPMVLKRPKFVNTKTSFASGKRVRNWSLQLFPASQNSTRLACLQLVSLHTDFDYAVPFVTSFIDPWPGYKLRGKINNAISARTKTLHNKYESCKKLASKLGITLPSLQKIIDVMTFRDLYFLHEDLKSCKWARQDVRDVILAYCLIERAREELLRVSVEVPRIVAGFDKDLLRAVRALKIMQHKSSSDIMEEQVESERLVPLAFARCRRIARVRSVVLASLRKLEAKSEQHSATLGTPTIKVKCDPFAMQAAIDLRFDDYLPSNLEGMRYDGWDTPVDGDASREDVTTTTTELIESMDGLDIDLLH